MSGTLCHVCISFRPNSASAFPFFGFKFEAVSLLLVEPIIWIIILSPVPPSRSDSGWTIHLEYNWCEDKSLLLYPIHVFEGFMVECGAYDGLARIWHGLVALWLTCSCACDFNSSDGTSSLAQ